MRSKAVEKKEIDSLVKRLVEIKDQKIMETFFLEILTDRELNDIARRYKVIEMLKEGKTYKEIQEKLQMSTVTISRLSGKIGYGSLEKVRIVTNPTNIMSKQKKKTGTKKVIRYKGAPTIRELFS